MSTKFRFSPAHVAGGNPLGMLLKVVMVLGVVLWTVIAGAAPAWAHAQLLGTTPANGTRLDTAPAEVRLRFTERVHPVPSGLSLLDASGKTLFSGTPSAAATGGPTELVWSVGETLPDGVYVVVWRVVSADSHPIHGAFSFSVGVAAPAPLAEGAQAGADRGVAVAFWAFRWLGYAGLAVFAGGVLVLWRCWPGGWASPRARRTLLIGWAVSVACAGAVFLLQGPYSGGGTLAQLVSPALMASTLGSAFGWLVLARLALLGIAGWLAFRMARGRVLLGVIAGVALPVTWAGAGHSGVGNIEALAIDALHLVAMSAWLGGLVLLWTALFARPVSEAASVLARFSPLAATCVGVLIVTGVYQAWRGVGSLAALSGSDYGRVLLYKVAAIALLVWLGAQSNAAARRAYAGIASSAPPADAGTDVGADAAPQPANAGARPGPTASSSPPARAGVALASRQAKTGVAAGVKQAETGVTAGVRQAETGVALASRQAKTGVAAGVRQAKTGVTASVRRESRAERDSRAAAQAGLRRSVRIETLTAAAVLALTALLVATPPGSRPAVAVPSTVSAEMPLTGGGRVQLVVDPARVGASLITVSVRDGGGRDWDVPEVTASLDLPDRGVGPLRVTLQRQQPGRYVSQALTLPLAGDWRVRVAVRTSEIDIQTVETRVSVI